MLKIPMRVGIVWLSHYYQNSFLVAYFGKLAPTERHKFICLSKFRIQHPFNRHPDHVNQNTTCWNTKFELQTANCRLQTADCKNLTEHRLKNLSKFSSSAVLVFKNRQIRQNRQCGVKSDHNNSNLGSNLSVD